MPTDFNIYKRLSDLCFSVKDSHIKLSNAEKTWENF